MKISVYCTGGTKLGFGHFFRAKTFVKAAPEGVEVQLVPVVETDDRHFFNELVSLTSMSEDESSALKAILNFAPDIVVLDTVSCSSDFISQIKKRVAVTASISPVFDQMQQVDYLFTRNSETDPIGQVKIYKGFQYALFNENCRFIPDEVYFHNLSSEFLTVGIAMGGGDAPNKTLQILRSISMVSRPCTFWVLLGEGYRHSYQDLVTSIRKDSNHEIILAKTNRSMWRVLGNCSVAVLAGGLTTLEAVYAGLPTLNIFDTEAHLKAAGKQLFEKGAAENIGFFNEQSLSRLRDRLVDLNDSKSQLLQMRERSKGSVDKLGSHRIYEVLKQIDVK